MIRIDVNFIKEDWDLFFEFSMTAAQMNPNDKKSSILAMEVEPVTFTDPIFLKWADQILDATLETIPTRSVVTRESGTSQIDQYFWENLTKAMGSIMGGNLQAQKSQQQPTSTPIAQAGRREFYSDWELAELIGYAQVYTEAGIPKIWRNFKCPRNVLTTARNCWQG